MTQKPHTVSLASVSSQNGGLQTYFTSLAELLASLLEAQRAGTLVARLHFCCKHALLILEEVEYLPLAPSSANLLVQLVNARHERGSPILTSSKAFREWSGVFGGEVIASALLDWLPYHTIAIIIRGASYRLRDRLTDLGPEAAAPPRPRPAEGR